MILEALLINLGYRMDSVPQEEFVRRDKLLEYIGHREYEHCPDWYYQKKLFSLAWPPSAAKRLHLPSQKNPQKEGVTRSSNRDLVRYTYTKG